MPLPGDPDWVASLPTLDAPAAKARNRGLIGPGLSAGVDDLQGLLGSAAQGAGKLFGLPTLERYGQGVAERNAAESQANGRPDLEIAPWHEGGADVLPWLGYQAAKQVPLIATYMAGGAGYRRLGGEAPEALAQIGTVVPRALGGGGLMPGASFAARRAAVQGGARDAGRSLAENFVGGSIAGLPIAFGAMVQEADQQPGGLTVQDAKKAALLSPVYSALDALEPAGLRNLFGRGQAGSIIRRVAGAAFAGAAAEVPQEGLQTALELSFRPDLSNREKFSHIVDAAVTGGAVGGVFGAAGGIRRMKRVDPATLGDEDIAGIVDEVLGATPPTLGLPAPAMYSNTAGETAEGVAGLDEITGANRSRLPGPTDIEGRAAIDGSTMVVGRNREGGRFAPGMSAVEQPPVVPVDLSRSYRNMTDAELFSAANAMANKAEAEGRLSPDQRDRAIAMQQEIEFRRQNSNGTLTNEDVSDVASRGGVAQPEPSAGDGGTVSAAPVPVNQPLDRDTLLKGISTRKSYSDARDATEIETILRARLEDGSTRKGDFELAKRLGIDTNAPAAPVETETPSSSNTAQQTPLATTPEPAAPANQKGGDPQFLLRWKDDVQKTGQKDKGARALKPTSEADAQRQIYQALGREGEIGDGLERLAIKYGVLDDQKRLTPLAVDIAQREAIPTEEAAKAARAQGFKGAAVSQFTRGAKAYTDSGQVAETGDATAAGAQWAAERNSVPRGALKKYDPRPVTDTDQALIDGTAKPEIRVVPPEVARGQTVNRAIDGTQESLGAAEDDVAQLKRMVREGKIEEAMDGLNRVQRGERLFQQPEPGPREPFAGARIDATSRALQGARGRAKATLDFDRDMSGRVKQFSKAEAERAIRKFELSRAIDVAFAEGAIDGKERLKLVGKLRRGRIKEVTDRIGDVPRATGTKLQQDTDRAARRAELHAALEEAFAQAEQEAEVSELDVDENGIIKPYIMTSSGQMQFTDADRTRVAEAMSFAIDNAGDPATILTHIADSFGANNWTARMARRFASLLPDGLTVKVLTRDEMDAVSQSYGWEGNTAGFNDRKNNAVVLAVDIPHVSVIVHEFMHAIIGNHISQRSAIGRKIERIFERIKKYGPPQDYAFTNAEEFMAEFLSRRQVRDYVNHISKMHPDSRGSLIERIWAAIRTAFGMPPRDAVEELIYLAEQAGSKPITAANPARNRMNLNPQQANALARDAISKISATADSYLNRNTVVGQGLKALVGAMPMTHIAKQYHRIFPETSLLVNAHADRRATTAVLAHLFDVPKNIADRLSSSEAGKKAIEITHYIMEATAWGIDPAKPWDDHKHLHGGENEATLQRLHDDFRRKYNILKKDNRHILYEAYRQINEMEHYAGMAMGIRELVVNDPTLMAAMQDFSADPMEMLRNDTSLHSPVAAQRHWRDQLDKYVKATSDYFVDLRGDNNTDEVARLSPLETYLKLVKQGLQTMQQAPYFHLGRHGQQFVSAQVRLKDDKKVDPAAVEHVALELDKIGVKHARISADLDKPTIFLRVETIGQRDEIANLFLRLEDEGWLDKGKDGTNVKRGPRDEGEWLPERTKGEMKKFINALEARFEVTDDMSEDEKTAASHLKARVKSIAYDVWLNMLPDAASSKVMTHRESKPGYDKDMGRNFAWRYNIGVNSLASMASQPYIDNAFEKMRGRLYGAKVARAGEDVDTITTLYGELALREEQIAQLAGDSSFDKWRAITHAYFLGASPSYMLINMTQLGVLLWPELAKKHGYVKAAKAMAKVTGLAFKIMSATLRQGFETGGVLRAADTIITPAVLQEVAGKDESLLKFLQHLIGSGIIDIGSSSRELGTIAEGQAGAGVHNTLRFAAAAGLWSETSSRLIAALAARELHQGDFQSTVDYAKDVVRESMLEYSTYNTPRLIGKMGLFGKFTPVMTQFMQYSTQVTFKLYRELYAGFSQRRKGESDKQFKERQAEARRFLTSHLAAVTTVAGTLGLPFATVAAWALEKLVDTFDDDDEPFDATAAWRNYLADIFGPKIGDMVARGLPRAGMEGFDLSQRAGEQNLLPFSQLLTDKRKWKDASSEAAMRSLGAPVSMLSNIVEGFGKIGDGDLMAGLQALVPAALKGPTAAYRMTDEGYTDTLGNKLPMTPTSSAYLMQLLGFNPAVKAEYSEERGDQAARRGVLIKQAKVIREKIIDAIEAGEDERARELIREAMEFTRDNPKFDPLSDIEGSITRRKKLQALAAATRTPIGVAPDDIDGRALTRYSPLEYQAQ